MALAFWVILIAGVNWYAWTRDLTALELMQQLIHFFERNPYSPLIFVLLYSLRPLVFFSATLLSIAAGYVFGPFWGVIYATLGSSGSAMLAYVIGHQFGQDCRLPASSSPLIQQYADRMRQHSFTTTLIMRLIFLHFDLVSYLAGFLHIRWQPFLLATLLGAFPGALMFVLFGASLEEFDGSLPAFNPWLLVTSVVILLLGIVLARFLKYRDTASPNNSS